MLVSYEATKADMTASDFSSLTHVARIRPMLSAAVLCLHVVAILSWSLPFQSRAAHWLNDLDGPYLRALGLDQHWNMFSNPRTIHESLEFQIRCSGGKNYFWRPALGGFSRKLFRDNLLLTKDPQLRIDLARYVARTIPLPGQTPVEVKILRHWCAIGPPRSTEQGPWRTQELLTYQVKPRDLQ